MTEAGPSMPGNQQNTRSRLPADSHLDAPDYSAIRAEDDEQVPAPMYASQAELHPRVEDKVKAILRTDLVLFVVEAVSIVVLIRAIKPLALLISGWFCLVVFKGICAHKSLGDAQMPPNERSAVFRSYSGYRACHSVILVLLWTAAALFYLYAWMYLRAMYGKDGPSNLKEHITAACYSALVAGHVLYASKTKNSLQFGPPQR